MEEHQKTRPSKTPYSLREQERLRNLSIANIKKLLLPDSGISKIILIGSAVKGSFGKYDEPGFRGNLYSDFDFIVFVKDDYVIPDGLPDEPDGKPFSKPELNLAYRIKGFVEEKYDAEIFFVKVSSLQSKSVCDEGEKAGIPMTESSQHPHITVYQRA